MADKTQGAAPQAAAKDPVLEAIRLNAGGVKLGYRAKKPTGFWKDPATQATLKAFNDGAISEEEAMKRLGVAPDYVAVRYYAARLKKTGTTVRPKAVAVA